MVTAGYDPERFMSVIQSLETKLYVTEEKLRDITQRLEEHQSHTGCQDPHLCSQLTQSRATAQHLGLLLHSQAKQSQRFAQETEACCRMLAGRFQVALNIVQACRERLQATPNYPLDLERQLASVAACLSTDESVECASAARLNVIQEQVKAIYLSDRLYVDLEKELQQVEVLQTKLQALSQEKEVNLLDEHEALNDALCQLQEDNSVLREGLERAEQQILSVETGKQRLMEDIKKIRNHHEEQMQKLEAKFQEKLKELQQIHEEEMKNLHDYYTKSKEKPAKSCTETPPSTPPNQPEGRRRTNEDNEIQMMGGDPEAMRAAYHKDLEKLKESCDQEVSAMEEMHRKQIGDLHEQHQQEMAELLKQKDQLLQEETAATMAAIVAMRRAHKHELEKSRRAQRIRESADITQLCAEYEGEIQLLQKELQTLSAQHTEKCLENSQLSQELQQERKSREADDLSQPQFSLNGKQMHVVPQANDFYEMEVILRAREAEMQFLRHEAQSLREELKIARMDKIYAQNKLKALCTNNQEEPHQQVSSRGEESAAWSPGKEPAGPTPEKPVSNTANGAFPKKSGKSSLMRQIKGVRSRSLKDGLSVQEKMKLFDSF
ncbi:myosin phosphatase Rho-interacting protein-like [Salarias fasciatus]|uniref:myosin phosphatase Rho-interacting protein-like n=1 Tax=Salarias fasciatus TaxID=181472 RepID=UPI001176DE34|nr:myosin phosphatase Rho-interacting protein-like [Salarias fasciatus]